MAKINQSILVRFCVVVRKFQSDANAGYPTPTRPGTAWSAGVINCYRTAKGIVGSAAGVLQTEYKRRFGFSPFFIVD